MFPDSEEMSAIPKSSSAWDLGVRVFSRTMFPLVFSAYVRRLCSIVHSTTFRGRRLLRYIVDAALHIDP